MINQICLITKLKRVWKKRLAASHRSTKSMSIKFHANIAHGLHATKYVESEQARNTYPISSRPNVILASLASRLE